MVPTTDQEEAEQIIQEWFDTTSPRIYPEGTLADSLKELKREGSAKLVKT